MARKGQMQNGALGGSGTHPHVGKSQLQYT